MSYDPIVALDIGATKIACMVGVAVGDRGDFEIRGSALVPFESVSDSTADPLLIARTLENALEKTGVSGELSRAVMAVSHPTLRSETVYTTVALGDEPVPIRDRDLKRLEEAALNQALSLDHDPLMIARLGFSGQGFERVMQPIGLPTMRLKGGFHIVSIPIAARRAFLQAAESVGLDVEAITYSLVAAFEGIADERTRLQRVLVIDVGGTTTDMGLFLDNSLQDSVSIAWGGAQLAKRLASAMRITFEQGENWVLEGTACPNAEAVAYMMGQWERLGNQIQAFIDNNPLPDVALIAGRAGLIDGFAEWLEKTTGMQVHFARCEKTHRYGDMARQVGLTPVAGLLRAQFQRNASAHGDKIEGFARFIQRTKTVLAEYF